MALALRGLRLKLRGQLGRPLLRGFTTLKAEGIADVELWGWGRGDVGQLGSPATESLRSRPHPIVSFGVSPQNALAESPALLKPSAVLQEEGDNSLENLQLESSFALSCGLYHSALVLGGELWIWGKGDGGRLGLGSEESHFKPVQNPHIQDVRSISLGGLHSAAVTQSGELYTWGYGGFGALGHGCYTRELLPRKVQLEEKEEIVYVSTGGAHTAAITSKGDLYCWGRDEGEGRLGHGSSLYTDEGVVSVPLMVDAIGSPVASVSCGGFFTMALTCDGQLWSWGANNNDELGREHAHGSKPLPIPYNENTRIIQVACGGFHSVALTEGGKVLTWGHGGHGQLGHNLLTNEKVPRLVESLADAHVIHVACGSSWTAAVTDVGDLYCWGKNRDSQLGAPADAPDICPIPTRACFDTSISERTFVISVAAGAHHGLCLSVKPEV